jgi:hypothetical protein
VGDPFSLRTAPLQSPIPPSLSVSPPLSCSPSLSQTDARGVKERKGGAAHLRWRWPHAPATHQTRWQQALRKPLWRRHCPGSALWRFAPPWAGARLGHTTTMAPSLNPLHRSLRAMLPGSNPGMLKCRRRTHVFSIFLFPLFFLYLSCRLVCGQDARNNPEGERYPGTGPRAKGTKPEDTMPALPEDEPPV